MTERKTLSPKQRRQRNREEMIEAIVNSARQIMREQGVAALNLNEIARMLGMQTPSLYEYFPNKLALYDHLFPGGYAAFSRLHGADPGGCGSSGWLGRGAASDDGLRSMVGGESGVVQTAV
ncbi:MAG: TetR/AcrR family transcriptional regulator [Chloroflexi bacterium]|uniref:TetR/AcrR family transcriptional regulator n=1 Tax=Candidatus Flexifilum breve TaxID=3140694 RepID=UPI00313759F5|nr:TetR/AcrR family transcriptional regulator [Chloroflexota bacterium]